MGTWIGVFLLLALAVWIVIDVRNLDKKAADDVRFALTATRAEKMLRARYGMLGMGAFFLAAAAVEWIHPHEPPFSGRGAWLFELLYYGIGPQALPLFPALLGTLLGLIAIFKRSD